MAGVSSCMKYSMFIFNFLFWDFNIDSSLFSGIDLLIAVGSIIMFFIGLLAILLLQIVAGILGGVYKSQLEASLNKTLTEDVGLLQSSLPKDKTFQETFRKFEIQTCSKVVIEFLKNNMIIVMGVAFGLALVEVLGLVFSMSLYCQIQRK
ncbi:hypothetical protein lerEdw1_021010 [Lerista edwardsae]|nr:hypothetical protein lerEdw1_021010 [Lerista edwardsae]